MNVSCEWGAVKYDKFIFGGRWSFPRCPSPGWIWREKFHRLQREKVTWINEVKIPRGHMGEEKLTKMSVTRENWAGKVPRWRYVNIYTWRLQERRSSPRCPSPGRIGREKRHVGEEQRWKGFSSTVSSSAHIVKTPEKYYLYFFNFHKM